MTMPKFAAKDAEAMLSRLDRVASHIQARHAAWGMPFDVAKAIVNALDKTADEIEISAFGPESLTTRQIEVVQGLPRQAQVLKRESDEPYMATFGNPMEPIQTEGDEPYMKAYGMPDQSSVVQHGQDMTGRKLAPGHGPFNSGT